MGNYHSKNNHFYKDGRCLKEHYYCNELCCNSEITMQTALYGGGRCHSCAMKNNTNTFKNGRYSDGHGYIRIYFPKHSDAVKKYILEHRLVMEKKLGRHLKINEVVHHINGIKNDNRLENLALLTKKTHDTYSILRKKEKRICELEKENKKLKGGK